MFGNRPTTYTSPAYTQTMMLPYETPMTQSYTQSYTQMLNMPAPPVVRAVFIPTPAGVPIPQQIPVPVDRPYAVPVPQPVPVPVDRPCAVPVPFPVSVPQPVPVPQPYVVHEQVPVPVPFPVAVPVQAPQEYYSVPSCRKVEYIIEEPVRIIRRCRRRRRPRCRSYCSAPAPLAPIIIPFPVQAPAPQPAPTYQVTEYIQDIYPPAQVFTQQVPVGYVMKNTVIEQPGIVQSQSNSGAILPSASNILPSTTVQSQLVQQLPTGQIVQRPLSAGGGGGGVQHVVLQQPNCSSTNSSTLFSTPSYIA